MEEAPATLAEGRFVVERQLGAGGMGSVWLARDTSMGGRRVALKVLRPTSDPRLLARFRREARLMAKLRHPGLIDVYDVHLDGPEAYIAQEFVEGSDLSCILARSGPLPLASCLRLARELAEALAYLHAQGVVHRDLKPANVMVQPDGRSRLADLGLAVDDSSTRLTAEGSMLGTILYMAPETASGCEPGPAADVFAFGLVLWEAATGCHPFFATSSPQAYLMGLSLFRLTLPDPPPGLSQNLVRTLTSCLELRVERRPPDGAALLNLLEKRRPAPGRASSLPAPSPPPPPSSTSTSTRPRDPAALGPALLLALVSLLALAGFLARGRLDTAGPPTSAPAAGPMLPTVTCLLDGIRLTLPGPPRGPVRARLETLDGELVVERPMRGAAVTLGTPPDVAGSLRWSLSGPDGTVEGVAAVGLRLLFDRGDLPLGLPPFLAGERLVLSLKPATILPLLVHRPPGEPLTLEPETVPALPVRDPLGLSALAPLGPTALFGLGRGSPGLLFTVPLEATVPPVVADYDGQRIGLALATSLPGGGCVVAGETGPDQVTVAGITGPPAQSAGDPLNLPGRSPLALVPMDDSSFLMAHVEGEAVVASVIRSRGTTTSRSSFVTLPGPAPQGRDAERPAAATTLPGGGAALGLRDQVIVVRGDGELRVHRIDAGQRSLVAAILPAADGGLDLLVAAVAAPLGFSTAALSLLHLGPGPDATPGFPTRLALLRTRIDDILPGRGTPRPGGGLVLFVSDEVLVTGPAPRFPPLHRISLNEGPAGVLASRDAVFLVTRNGRVWGFDLERN